MLFIWNKRIALRMAWGRCWTELLLLSKYCYLNGRIGVQSCLCIKASKERFGKWRWFLSLMINSQQSLLDNLDYLLIIMEIKKSFNHWIVSSFLVKICLFIAFILLFLILLAINTGFSNIKRNSSFFFSSEISLWNLIYFY